MNDTLRSLQSPPDDPQSIQLCRATDFCQAPAPDTRWQSARHVWRSGIRLNWDDHGPQVIRAIRFFHAAQSQDSSQQLEELAHIDPIMIKAMKLHHADRLRHLELQCRILARQTSEEIAYELNTESAAVIFYEDLFFDVRDELNRESDHLFQHIIGLSLTGPSPIESYARLTAYRNSPGTIPAWLDYLPHRHEEHDLTTESGRQRESIAQYLTTFTWDSQSRNTQVELPSTEIVTYVYNGDHLRVQRDDGTDITNFLYDYKDLIIESDETLTTIRRLVYVQDGSAQSSKDSKQTNHSKSDGKPSN